MNTLKAKIAQAPDRPKPANDDEAALIRLGIERARKEAVQAKLVTNSDGQITGARLSKALVRRGLAELRRPANDNALLGLAYTVADEMKEALRTLRRLPPARHSSPSPYRAAWPDIVRSVAEVYAMHAVKMPPIPPSARAIERMDRALSWLSLVSERERKLLLAKAGGVPNRELAKQFGCSYETVRLDHVTALLRIALHVFSNPKAMRGL